MSNLKCPTDRSKWSKFKGDVAIAATGTMELYLMNAPPEPPPIPNSTHTNYFNIIKLRQTLANALKNATDFIQSMTSGTALEPVVRPHLIAKRPDLAWQAIVNEYEQTDGQSTEALLLQRLQEINYDNTTTPLTVAVPYKTGGQNPDVHPFYGADLTILGQLLPPDCLVCLTT